MGVLRKHLFLVRKNDLSEVAAMHALSARQDCATVGGDVKLCAVR
jgi:hypothetical protein